MHAANQWRGGKRRFGKPRARASASHIAGCRASLLFIIAEPKRQTLKWEKKKQQQHKQEHSTKSLKDILESQQMQTYKFSWCKLFCRCARCLLLLPKKKKLSPLLHSRQKCDLFEFEYTFDKNIALHSLSWNYEKCDEFVDENGWNFVYSADLQHTHMWW